MLRTMISCAALMLCGAGVAQAQDGYYTDAEMREINCVLSGILESGEDAAMIGTLALSARESTYNVDMLDERMTPFVEACVKRHGWTDAQARYARALGAVSAAMNTQVVIAREAGATREDLAAVMPLADALPDMLRDMLSDGGRADDATRAQLEAEIRKAGVTPAEKAMGELVYVLELAVRSREAQLVLGGSLFN